MKKQIALIALCGLWTGLAPAEAALSGLVDDRYSRAHRVRKTPFDGKLEAAGFFDESAVTIPSSARSAEDLMKVAHSFRYQSDKGYDFWQSAEKTDSTKKGDCEDKAIWLYKAMRKLGYRNVYLNVGRYKPSAPNLHAWVTFLDESGNIRLMDPALQQRAWNIQDAPGNLYQPLFAFSGNERYRFL